MRTFLRDNGLVLFFGTIFLLALAGQAVAGFHDFNDGQISDGAAPVTFATYLTSSDFGADVAENWQSEYLQFALYILAHRVAGAARLAGVQAGREGRAPRPTRSRRSAPTPRHDSPAAARAGGPRLWWYSNSLGLTMGLIFLGSWRAQAVAGRAAYNAAQLRDVPGPARARRVLRLAGLLEPHTAELAVGVPRDPVHGVLSIYLRQRGSPESKPVGAAHSATGVEG